MWHFCGNFVDRKYETVILPVYGVATPFHISTIKVLICVVITVIFKYQTWIMSGRLVFGVQTLITT